MITGISEAACRAKLEGDYHLASTEPVAAIWGTDGIHSTCRFGRDLSATPVLGACRFFGPTFSIDSTRTNPCIVDGKTFVREPAPACPSTRAAQIANCQNKTFPAADLQKVADGVFQQLSWSVGCHHAALGSAGNRSTCLALCDYTSGCCSEYNSENHQTQATGTASHSYDSTCQSNSCGGSGCCAASQNICQSACDRYFTLPPSAPSPPSTSRKYLGTNIDGTALPLWSAPTANQRWEVTEAGANSTIHAHTATGRVYLGIAQGIPTLWSAAGDNQQWTYNCTDYIMPPPPPLAPPGCWASADANNSVSLRALAAPPGR